MLRYAQTPSFFNPKAIGQSIFLFMPGLRDPQLRADPWFAADDPRPLPTQPAYCEGVPPAAVTLPDRVTVLTCIGCGAMGREERCERGCSERKLPLVPADDYNELLAKAGAAQARAARLAPVVRSFAEADAEPAGAREALSTMRDSARQALHDAGPGEPPNEWASPDAVIGWWCERCGNVDMPQPCLGVCVWRPADWVNLALYEKQLGRAEPSLRAARALTGFLGRVAGVVPRADQWQRNWAALQHQARVALEEFSPESPALDPPPCQRPTARPPDPVIRVHLWPR
jgi:hypothetical protein